MNQAACVVHKVRHRGGETEEAWYACGPVRATREQAERDLEAWRTKTEGDDHAFASLVCQIKDLLPCVGAAGRTIACQPQDGLHRAHCSASLVSELLDLLRRGRALAASAAVRS